MNTKIPGCFVTLCDEIKQNESEVSQTKFSVFRLIANIIFKATFHNTPH